MRLLQQRNRVKDLPIRTNGIIIISIFFCFGCKLYVLTDDERDNGDDDDNIEKSAKVSNVVLFTDEERERL